MAPPDRRTPTGELKVTPAFVTGLPVLSRTTAMSRTLPPDEVTEGGSACREMNAARGVDPILTDNVVAVVAVPVVAITVALPRTPSARKVAVATPLELVVASGSIVAMSTVNRTTVPLRAGCPLGRITTAVMVELPVDEEMKDGLADRVKVEPLGATGETLEQPKTVARTRIASARRLTGRATRLIAKVYTEG